MKARVMLIWREISADLAGDRFLLIPGKNRACKDLMSGLLSYLTSNGSIKKYLYIPRTQSWFGEYNLYLFKGKNSCCLRSLLALNTYLLNFRYQI